MTGFDLDRESDRVLWEKIKSEDNVTKALHMMADLVYGMVISHKRHDEELHNEIKALQKVVLGNGDPAGSLVTRVAALNEKLTHIDDDTTEIKFLLIGDVRKGADNESLLDRIQHAQKTSQTAAKIVWIVLTIVIGEIVVRLFGLL